MKVLLINPPRFQLYIPISTRYFLLSLAYLAAAVKENGDQVSIFDSLAYSEDTHIIKAVNQEQADLLKQHKYYKNILHWGASWERILSEVKKYEPDLVGITCHQASAFLETSILAKKIKEQNSEINTLVGGAFATVRPEIVLGDKNIDYISRGEGEQTIVELINALKTGADLSKIAGIGYKSNCDPIITKDRAYLDINTIPFPALELLPLERYFKKQGYRYAFLLTSRGCTNQCSYCGVTAVMGCEHRKLTPENVLMEIKRAHHLFQIDNFYIRDDNFTLDLERTHKILDYIIEDKELDNCKFYAVNGIDANYLTKELVRKMKKANFEHLTLAIETIDEDIHGHIEKKLTTNMLNR